VSQERRLLVLGGTGMLGHEVVRSLTDRFAVHASVRDVGKAERFGLPATLHPLDAGQPALDELLEMVKPFAVVNCIGLIKQREEAADPTAAIEVNSLFPHLLADAVAKADARLIQISTDCVFSGQLEAPAAYTEADTPDPVDLYGRSKLLGEVADGGALTVRTSIIGWELEHRLGLLEWFAAQSDSAVDGYSNARFSGLTTRALAEVIAQVILEHRNLEGLYHVAAEPISKLELLEALRDALGMSCEIRPVEEPRINRALDASRFREDTGIAVPSWSSMLDSYLRE
jgi:dTDP-4-dehydrorhamnose reductase